ncbi:MBOAT family O-acyltransferase [Mucilaginibacter gilvus]|nr:MBOAT family O-acyltransferase [Mucilaginibacter gilvus]
MAFIPVYILILFFTIIIDYISGILIERQTGKKRRWLLIVSLVANIGILAIFKYYNFFIDSLNNLLLYNHQATAFQKLAIVLPIGLSFHTFQAMSYTIEVYRGNQKAERHFGIYALYVMFYPQLVAGPIERPQNLLHQFYEKHDIDYKRITDGLKLMAWGLFKKVVIADRLAILVDNVYDNPLNHHGLSFIIATVFFSFQIFCDFSGYSDMAIGMARVIGFKLMKNFNSPYHAKSVQEFWGRWHISLSTWFKDYLYIPLGGRRVTVPRWYLNLFIVFLISGLWHGANWTFIAWGALHGFYIISGHMVAPIITRFNSLVGIKWPRWLSGFIKTLTTFTLVSFAWIFFRARSIAEALHVIKSIFTETYTDVYHLLHHKPGNSNLGLIGEELWLATLGILLLEFVHIAQQKYNIYKLVNERPAYMRWGLYYAFLLILLFFNVSGNKAFIYFQF